MVMVMKMICRGMVWRRADGRPHLSLPAAFLSLVGYIACCVSVHLPACIVHIALCVSLCVRAPLCDCLVCVSVCLCVRFCVRVRLHAVCLCACAYTLHIARSVLCLCVHTCVHVCTFSICNVHKVHIAYNMLFDLVS